MTTTLKQRQDELARDLTREAYGDEVSIPSYRIASNVLQVAIDRIIKLEGGAA